MTTLLLVAGCTAAAAGSDSSRPGPSGPDASGPAAGTSTEPAGGSLVEAATTTSAGLVGQGDGSESVRSLPDLVAVSADGHAAVIRDGGMTEPVTGLIAGDDTTMVTTSSDDTSTTVAWIRLADGSETGSATLDGDLRAVATDMTGRFVAMKGPNPAAPNGTEIVIATAAGEQFRAMYDTELQPEGFSNAIGTNGMPIGMFVQEFLDPPIGDAEAPRWYQVRVLDTATGQLQLPQNLRDKSQQVDEQMLGFGRTHVLSPANGLLFTLYRGLDDDGSNYAFVHTLGFVNGVWCLDLPSEMSLEWELGALGLADHESKLIVASANGFVTEFGVGDITDLNSEPAPRRTVRAWLPGPEPVGPTVATSAAVIVVGQGTTLRWIDPESLTETHSLDWDMQIESVTVLANGDVVAAGSRRLSQISPAGELVAEMPLPDGFGAITRMLILPAE